MSEIEPSLIERAQEIIHLGHKDLKTYLGERILDIMQDATEEKNAMKLDSVTIFASQPEGERLKHEAGNLGKLFYDHEGTMYDLAETELPTSVVRIHVPEPGDNTIGVVDYAFGRDARQAAEMKMRLNAPYLERDIRTVRKDGIGSDPPLCGVLQAINPSSKIIVASLTTSFAELVKRA